MPPEERRRRRRRSLSDEVAATSDLLHLTFTRTPPSLFVFHLFAAISVVSYHIFPFPSLSYDVDASLWTSNVCISAPSENFKGEASAVCQGHLGFF